MLSDSSLVRFILLIGIGVISMAYLSSARLSQCVVTLTNRFAPDLTPTVNEVDLKRNHNKLKFE